MTLPTRRIFITGAAGAGSTTLARALASRWSSAAHDTDDYFWLPTNPPYSHRRPVAERLPLMQAMFLPRVDWVLSGSVMGWGEGAMESVDHIIFLCLAPRVRLQRLADRERHRFGDNALAPGGAVHAEHIAFMAWAAGYDDPSFEGRNIARHRQWLRAAGPPVTELDSDALISALTDQVEAVLAI